MQQHEEQEEYQERPSDREGRAIYHSRSRSHFGTSSRSHTMQISGGEASPTMADGDDPRPGCPAQAAAVTPRGRGCVNVPAWGGGWGDGGSVSAEPTLEYLADLARFPRAPVRGDWFHTKPRGRQSPVCVEYSALPPSGIAYGKLPAGSWMQAQEIAVVLIPADPRRCRLPEHGIAIRCDSTIVPGVDAWINISRNHVMFAVLHRGGWGDGGGRGHGGTWASGDRWWGDRWRCLKVLGSERPFAVERHPYWR
jgi:hypothetical protein